MSNYRFSAKNSSGTLVTGQMAGADSREVVEKPDALTRRREETELRADGYVDDERDREPDESRSPEDPRTVTEDRSCDRIVLLADRLEIGIARAGCGAFRGRGGTRHRREFS